MSYGCSTKESLPDPGKGGLRSLLRLGSRDVQLLDGRARGERAAPSYREVVVLTYAASCLIPRHGLPRRV